MSARVYCPAEVWGAFCAARRAASVKTTAAPRRGRNPGMVVEVVPDSGAGCLDVFQGGPEGPPLRPRGLSSGVVRRDVVVDKRAKAVGQLIICAAQCREMFAVDEHGAVR